MTPPAGAPSPTAADRAAAVALARDALLAIEEAFDVESPARECPPAGQPDANGIAKSDVEGARPAHET